MFAFALWDTKRRRLVLARDRFGKKPLYYADARRTRCSSPPSSRRSSSTRAARASSTSSALARYLALEYVPTPHSIFAGVRKLPGGSLARARATGEIVDRAATGTSALRRRRPRPARTSETSRSSESCLRAAVRRRLVSDVPLGAFLSGGIDSSTVVALMARRAPAGSVKTFSIGFDDASFDESAHARRVAAHLGTDHHEEVFTPDVMLDLLPTVVAGSTSRSATPRSCRPTCSPASRASTSRSRSAATAATSCSPATRRSRPTPSPASTASRGCCRRRGRRSPAAAGLDGELQLRLQAQAVPARRSVAPRRPAAAWLGSFSPAEQARAPRGARPAIRSRSTAARSRRADGRPLDAADLPLRGDLPPGRHPREGRPGEHGLLARGAGAVPRRRAGRVPQPRARSAQAATLDTKRLLKRALARRAPARIADRPKKGFGIPVAGWFEGELAGLLDELSPDRSRAKGCSPRRRSRGSSPSI